jgi:hypothetical protein
MKFMIISTLLALSGVFLFFYTINNKDVLDWSRLDGRLQERRIESQVETKEFVVDYYRRGLLTEYIDMQNAGLLGGAMFLTVFGATSLLHLIIDKLFFKKFYQEPEVVTALRRGLILAVLPVGLGILLIYNILEPVLIGTFLLILVCLEFVLAGVFKPKVNVVASGKTT